MTWKDSILKLLDLIQWLVGVMSIMASFGAVREAPFFALGALVLGMWLVPPVRRFVLRKLPERTGKWAKWLVPIGAFILLAGNTPEPEAQPAAGDVPTESEPLEEEESGAAETAEDSVTAASSEVPSGTGAVPESAPTSESASVPEESPATAPEPLPLVQRVTDGDTFDLESGETVRLIGINAPERGQPFYDEATALLRDLVEDRSVRLEPDVSERDRYGRLLAYVYVGDSFVNRQLVAAGLAKSYAYEPDTALQSELDAAQAEAQAAGRGMWQAVAADSSSATAGSFAVAAFDYDSPGNDNETLDQESVTLRNTSSEAISLAGYVLSDEANRAYTFSAFTLEAGASVRIITGSGTDTAATVFWGQDGAVWNNGGDTLYLANPAGDIVFTHSY